MTLWRAKECVDGVLPLSFFDDSPIAPFVHGTCSDLKASAPKKSDHSGQSCRSALDIGRMPGRRRRSSSRCRIEALQV